MDFIGMYLDEVRKLLDIIESEERETIQRVAELMSQAIINGGIGHVFGTGHSSMACREIFSRAGTLSCIRVIGLHQDLEKYERVEGIAKYLLADYDIRPGEVLIVFSNSGRNALPIEVSLLAKEKGATIVAITSLQHSQSTDSRHSSGKKLFELADIVVDTHVPAGDAGVRIPELPMKVGPLSTLANAAIINAIVVQTAASMVARGETPPVRISRNMPGGDEHNQRFKEIYGVRIPELKA